MRIDRIIIIAFTVFAITSISLLLFGRWRVETTEFNLTTGTMRVVTDMCGNTYKETAVESGLEWMGNVKGDDRSDKWVPVSVVESSLVDTEGTFGKRVGMVFIDAVTMAGILFKDQQLRDELKNIRSADYETIWKLRSELREAAKARKNN